MTNLFIYILIFAFLLIVIRRAVAPTHKRNKAISKEAWLESFFTEERLAHAKANPKSTAFFDLYAYALWKYENLRKEALDEIEKRLSGMEPDQFFRLDQYLRSRSYATGFEMATPERVKQIRKDFDDHFRAFGMLAGHSNGYVREEVLKALGEVHDGNEIPFIVLRICDWVEPVRKLARNLLEQRLNPSQAAVIAMNLSLIQRVTQAQREGASEIWRKVLRSLANPEGQKGLERALEMSGPLTRRICVEQLDPERKTTIERALQDADRMVQATAAQKMLARPDIYPAEIEKMGISRSSLVRLLYLERLINTQDKSLETYLTKALTDESLHVRGAARFQLRKMGRQDFASVYAEELNSQYVHKKTIGILGLGEIEAVEYAKDVIRFVDFGSQGVEAAALKTLSILEPGKHEDLFRKKLLKSSGKVAKEALRGYVRVPGVTNYSTLNKLLEDGLSLKVGLRFSKWLSDWDKVIILLRISAQAEQSLAKQGLDKLSMWLFKGYAEASVPSLERAKEIKSYLKKLEGRVPEKQVNQLLFALGR